MQRAGGHRRALAGVLLAAGVVATALLLVDATPSGPGDAPAGDPTPGAPATAAPAGVLPLPAAGTVAAEFLDDGTPVFVVADERLDTPVVLDAESTHRIDWRRAGPPAWVLRTGRYSWRTTWTRRTP